MRMDREQLLRVAAYLQRERGSVTLGQFNPNRELQLANSRIPPLVMLASVPILLAGLVLNMLTGQPIPVPVAVDASPFATVRVEDANQAVLLTSDTPFVVPLVPGTYSFQFRYGSRTVTKSVLVSRTGNPQVRHEFWESRDIEDLVGRFLSDGVEH